MLLLQFCAAVVLQRVAQGLSQFTQRPQRFVLNLHLKKQIKKEEIEP